MLQFRSGRNSHVTATCAALALAGSIATYGQVQRAVIGILEDNPGHFAGSPHYRAVRVVFRKERSGWVAFPGNCRDQGCLRSVAAQFPAQVNWTVSFDRRDIGHVVGRTPSFFEFYSTVGQQEIVGNTSPPTVGKPSEEFGGFLAEPVFRPLIAVSPPNYRDPENWKPTQIRTDTIAAIRRAFRNRFPNVENCTKQDIEHAKPWAYSDTSVRVTKGYASNRRFLIAEAVLTGYECDGPSDEAFSSQWFVVTRDQRVRFLDSAMWFVDVGDYDNDGRSELVFSVDEYNRGGYKLFYDDFRRKAVFEFSYH